jgi:hypothetical protein
MSIINDALKKAEERREGEPQDKKKPQEQDYKRFGLRKEQSPQKPAGRPTRPAVAGYARGKKELKLLISVGAGAVVLSLAVLAILLRGGFQLSFVPLGPAEVKIEEAPRPTQTAETETTPQPAAAAEDDKLMLTGIVHGEGMPMAVINGSVYIEGDSIRKSRIIKISEDKVILEKEGRIVELQVR